MRPFPISVLTDITPLLELRPAGPFGALVTTAHSGMVRVRIEPNRLQWFIETEEATCCF